MGGREDHELSHAGRPARRAAGLAVTTLALLLGSLPAAAQPLADFDHLRTAFPLTGAHERVPCESCHVGGVFQGTPRECGVCHSGGGMWQATRKPLDHIPTSERCGDCHITTSWSVVRFDHAGITDGCIRCHNGMTATGKPGNHPPSSNDCETCHRTIAWVPAGFDHSGVTGACFSCHNGSIATGKPMDHPPSSNDCEQCHRTTAWRPAGFDHTGIVDGCFACHNGSTARGKPNDHPPSSNDCEMCHQTTSWRTVGFDHTGIVDGCITCHNGSTARGKPNDHPPSSNDCQLCHRTSAWLPASFDHASVAPGTCSSCHGVNATGKGPGHFMTSAECDACHSTTAWTPIRFTHMSPGYVDHGSRVGCRDCHTTNSETIAWPAPAYQPDCAGCHANDFRTGPHVKTESPTTYYTVSELRDCTGACHIYQGGTIKEFRQGEHRATRGEW